MNRKLIAGGLVALLCLAEALLAQDTPMDTTSDSASTIAYTFKIVNYPHDSYTQFLGINNVGEIVGYHGLNNGFTLKLPNSFTLEDFPGAVQTQVTAVNDLGQTAGFYTDRAGVQHGFLKLGANFKAVDYPGSIGNNQLVALNSASQAIGFYSEASGPSIYYLYERGKFSLIRLPNEIKSSATITGINNAGQVSGYYSDNASSYHGFLLNEGQLKTLTFPGAGDTFAYGLNNIGQVVGYYDGYLVGHGFVWSEKTGFQTIDVPAGQGVTMVNGINDKGVIVGGAGTCFYEPFSCNGFVGTL